MSQTPPLPEIRRIVTGHDSNATAVVSKDTVVPAKPIPHGAWVSSLWSSYGVPCDVNSSQDMGQVETGLANEGCIYRIVDFPPNSKAPEHRSITLDFIYVLKGTVILTLDDGSRTTVRENETIVQQATMHGWDNETDSWARILCVLIKAEPLSIGGKTLEAEVPFKV